MSQVEQHVGIHYIKFKKMRQFGHATLKYSTFCRKKCQFHAVCRKKENDLREEPTPPTPDRRGYQNIKMSKYKIATGGVFPLNKEINGIKIYSNYYNNYL